MKQCRFFAMLLFAATLAFSSCGGGGSGDNGGGKGDGDGDTVVNISAISGVTPPNFGETPVSTITETDQYTGTVNWSGSPLTFAAATVYTATITLTAKKGYTINDVPANFFKVAGATATNGSDSGVVTAVFPATGAVPPTVISIAEIPGVIAPKYNETPVTAITETTQYTGAVAWSGSPVTFAATTVYTATITLTAKTGYTFNGVSADFFKIAGATTTNGAGSGVVTAVFLATGAVPPTVVNISTVSGVAAPVLGAIPVAAITETAQYTGTVDWDGGWAWSQRFGGQKAYTATITLTAKSGYTLTGVAANSFMLAGATFVTNSADSGVITAVFPATASVAIGDSALGGKVAYILQSGDPGYVAGEQRGLIAAAADYSTNVRWITGGATQTTSNNGTSGALGTGQANTNAMKNQSGFTGGSAKVCDDYINTDSGTGVYSDWYLPSKNELNELYLHKTAIGGFEDVIYWSSTEYNETSACYEVFSNGISLSISKNNGYKVRPIRSF